jgi:adenylosuccinate synthase
MKPRVLVGAQWGDEAKGKHADILAKQWADLVVAPNGGNNSGRTVWIGDEKYVFHSLSPAALHGKRALIAAGTVNDLKVLLDDKIELEGRGVEADIGIDPRSHVILPYHIELDIAREEKRQKEGTKIGTTSRGIGPCYEDRKNRSGIRFGDFVSPEIFEPKFRQLFEEKSKLLEMLSGKTLEDRLGKGVDKVLVEQMKIADALREYEVDVSEETLNAINSGMNVLFEMKQGAGLDNDFGTYHYCTSSNTIAAGVFPGVGLPPIEMDVIGIAKAYCTKVGPGPFPSEIQDPEIARKVLGAGQEYGSTTGRPRRVGWFDVPQMKLSHRLNNFKELIIGKGDVLSELDEVLVVHDYELDGKLLHQRVPTKSEEYLRVKPVYRKFGNLGQIAGVQNYSNFSGEFRGMIDYLADQIGTDIRTISTGKDRSENVTRDIGLQTSLF